MGQIKISKVELEIGKNKINLSLEEAYELKKILNDAFPEEKVVLPISLGCAPTVVNEPLSSTSDIQTETPNLQLRLPKVDKFGFII